MNLLYRLAWLLWFPPSGGLIAGVVAFACSGWDDRWFASTTFLVFFALLGIGIGDPDEDEPRP